MLTPEQQKWIDHLGDENKVNIVPFDPTSEEKFQKIKKKIHQELGSQFDIQHRGASGMGISGQDEIDVYVPVSKDIFDTALAKLKIIFGKPASHYELERARFRADMKNKRIDVFLINEDSSAWINCIKFEGYIRAHAECLEEYKKLKEKMSGFSVRDYYRNKIEFINEILEKAEEEETH
ncbi:GrpB family protein [Patescibacteria group bacterium]|nr:GrpB family protein [Patescibacteria group bacterium]